MPGLHSEFRSDAIAKRDHVVKIPAGVVMPNGKGGVEGQNAFCVQFRMTNEPRRIECIMIDFIAMGWTLIFRATKPRLAGSDGEAGCAVPI
jgi:hypothetical protein